MPRRPAARAARRTRGSGRVPLPRAPGASRTARTKAACRSRSWAPLLRRPHLHREAPQLHEAFRVAMVEGVLAAVGRERQVVQGPLRTATYDGALTGREPQAHLAGHVVLRRVDVCVDRLAQRAEPQAVVDEVCPPLLEAGLVVRDLTLEREVLDRAVRRDERERARHLVELAALYAHAAVLDHVHPPEPVPATERVDRAYQLGQRRGRAVERLGHPALAPPP